MQILRVIPSNFTRLLISISFSGIIITCFQVYVVDLTKPGSKIKQLKLLCHSGGDYGKIIATFCGV